MYVAISFNWQSGRAMQMRRKGPIRIGRWILRRRREAFKGRLHGTSSTLHGIIVSGISF